MIAMMMIGLTMFVYEASAQAPDADIFAVINLNNPKRLFRVLVSLLINFNPGWVGWLIP